MACAYLLGIGSVPVRLAVMENLFMLLFLKRSHLKRHDPNPNPNPNPDPKHPNPKPDPNPDPKHPNPDPKPRRAPPAGQYAFSRAQATRLVGVLRKCLEASSSGDPETARRSGSGLGLGSALGSGSGSGSASGRREQAQFGGRPVVC